MIRQRFGYWRWQLSWGGPSDEFRLYGGGKLVYHFADWFDGAEFEPEGTEYMDLMDVFEFFLDGQEERHGF